MNKKIGTLMLLAALSAGTASAQKMVRKYIREGNSLYGKEDYLNSEISYRKALEANANDSVAQFNLGNSLYRQQKMEDALKQYTTVAASAAKADNKDMAARSYYNAGNVCMAAQQYDKALQLYKQSLRLNPADDEARYNMVLASKLLQQQQNQDQNQDQDKDKDQQDQQQQQDQNKDNQQQNQDKQQDQQNQDQQNQNQDQQQNQQQDQQQQQQGRPNMSQEQAEAILNAANQEEKNVQDKVKAKLMEQVSRKKTDKDW
jgi:tetratricopeptide (TPR) repeat protein